MPGMWKKISGKPVPTAAMWQTRDVSLWHPHLYLPQFLDEETERELALFMDIALLSRCVELWVFGDVISAGMEKEIQYAQRKGKPIRYINEVK
jgi:hypothetical protein